MKNSAQALAIVPESDSKPRPVATPFLKWAGGKTQLLQAIEKNLPSAVKAGAVKKYFEPMIGGGAVFLHLAQKYNFEALYLSDVNEELVIAYRTIQQDVPNLVSRLQELEKRYHALTEGAQEKYFYEIRRRFNAQKGEIDLSFFEERWAERTAQLIFLNKTCFNGLFRVNSKGHFNVPFGRYDNPRICAARNLAAISALLQKTEIRHADFSVFARRIDNRSFVYFDPPYRPLNKTSNFTAYAKGSFNDEEQLRLSNFCRTLDKKGALFMLSNSDPKNADPQDAFFEEAYSGFNIIKVPATRMINSNAQKRGVISELLITNYNPA